MWHHEVLLNKYMELMGPSASVQGVWEYLFTEGHS